MSKISVNSACPPAIAPNFAVTSHFRDFLTAVAFDQGGAEQEVMLTTSETADVCKKIVFHCLTFSSRWEILIKSRFFLSTFSKSF